MAPRENENNAYAKFWGDKQRALSIRKQFGGPAGVGAFNCGAINCFYKPGFGPSVEILLVTNL